MSEKTPEECVEDGFARVGYEFNGQHAAAMKLGLAAAIRDRDATHAARLAEVTAKLEASEAEASAAISDLEQYKPRLAKAEARLAEVMRELNKALAALGKETRRRMAEKLAREPGEPTR